MTENKRFYLDENGINDREYEFSILGEDELVDIINELNEENEQLKDALNQRTEQCDKYYKENEQLKKENQHFRKVFGNKYDAYIDGKIGGNVNEL